MFTTYLQMDFNIDPTTRRSMSINFNMPTYLNTWNSRFLICFFLSDLVLYSKKSKIKAYTYIYQVCLNLSMEVSFKEILTDRLTDDGRTDRQRILPRERYRVQEEFIFAPDLELWTELTNMENIFWKILNFVYILKIKKLGIPLLGL